MRRGLLLALLAAAPVGMIAAGGGCAADFANGGRGGLGGSGGSSTTTWPSGGSGGSIVTTTGTTTGTGAGSVAAPCTTDADCQPDLDCLAATATDPVFGGGPAGGFCTRACTSDYDCPQPGGACYQLDPAEAGRCTLACEQGPATTGIAGLFDPLDPAKCRGREDLRCGKPAKATAPICLPTCGDDAHCDGRLCDPRSAVCVDDPAVGLPFGALCDPTLDNPCAGRCVGFDSAVGMCSSPCVLGGEKIATADCGGPEHGLCAFHTKTTGPGDIGHCTPSCTVQSDCPAPAFWCLSVPGLTELVQRGYCFAASPCPGGQADCDAALVCTATELGAFCLDPLFSLGAIGLPDAGAPDAGDAGDAGAESDAGDGGDLDAGAPDAGDDAGP